MRRMQCSNDADSAHEPDTGVRDHSGAAPADRTVNDPLTVQAVRARPEGLRLTFQFHPEDEGAVPAMVTVGEQLRRSLLTRLTGLDQDVQHPARPRARHQVALRRGRELGGAIRRQSLPRARWRSLAQVRASKKSMRQLTKEKLTDPLGLSYVVLPCPPCLNAAGPRICRPTSRPRWRRTSSRSTRTLAPSCSCPRRCASCVVEPLA